MSSENKKLSLLLGFIMTMAWISQSLMDLAIIFLVGFYIYKNHQTFRADTKRILNLKPLLAGLFGYFFVAILGYLVNADPAYEASTNLSKFLWIFQLLFFVMVAAKIQWEDLFTTRLPQLFQFFTWATFVPIVCSFNIYLFSGVDIFFMQQTNYRIIGLLNSATYHGLIGGLIFTFLLPLAVLNWKKFSLNNKIQYIVLMSLILLSTVLTMTRGVWLSLTCATIVLVYFLNYKKSFFTVLGLALIAAVIFQGPISQLIRHRANSDSCRLKILNTHVNMFKQFPFLGAGYRDNLRDIKPYWPESDVGQCRHLRDHGNHAHNQYLNVLATTGTLGFMTFMLFHLYFFIANLGLIRRYKNNPSLFPFCISLLAMQVFFLVSNLTETSFEYGKVRSVLLLVWGAVLGLSYRASNSTPTSA